MCSACYVRNVHAFFDVHSADSPAPRNKKSPTCLSGGASKFKQIQLRGELEFFLAVHHQSGHQRKYADA
jgi:hypothetical protein